MRVRISGNRTGTYTASGIIPYKKYRGISCPVALKMPASLRRGGYSAPLPALRDSAGRLVYVLPGGEHVMFEG